MPPATPDILDARLRELSIRELILKTQLSSLAEELSAVQREITKLQDAKLHLVNRGGVDSGQVLGYTTRDATMVNRVERRRRKPTAVIQAGSIKEDALKALSERPNGLLALDVLAQINASRDVPIERTSLSPQLSRLRQAGLVTEQKSIWRITDAGQDALLSVRR